VQAGEPAPVERPHPRPPDAVRIDPLISNTAAFSSDVKRMKIDAADAVKWLQGANGGGQRDVHNLLKGINATGASMAVRDEHLARVWVQPVSAGLTQFLTLANACAKS
jgi:hypothetical protein